MLHTIILLIICFITVHMYILALYDRYQKKKLDSAWIKDLVRHGEEWGEYDDVAASEIEDKDKEDEWIEVQLVDDSEDWQREIDLQEKFGIRGFK